MLDKRVVKAYQLIVERPCWQAGATGDWLERFSAHQDTLHSDSLRIITGRRNRLFWGSNDTDTVSAHRLDGL